MSDSQELDPTPPDLVAAFRWWYGITEKEKVAAHCAALNPARPDPIADKARTDAAEIKRLIISLLTALRDNRDFWGRPELLSWGADVLRRIGQLITIGEAQEMVAAAYEAAAVIAEDHNEDIWSYHTGNRCREGFDPVAEAIRALAAKRFPQGGAV